MESMELSGRCIPSKWFSSMKARETPFDRYTPKKFIAVIRGNTQ